VSGQLHAPANLSPRKEPWYPLDRKLGWPQSRFGCGGEEETEGRKEGRKEEANTRRKKEMKLQMCTGQ